MQGRVLIIAGSDSGGGAGIQADIKTVTMLGGYAATAITAVTAQNTQGVFGVHNIPADFVRKQIELVLVDIGADAIKTGMLSNAEIIRKTAYMLKKHNIKNFVLDPVMVAKGGEPLLEEQAVSALKRDLIPLSTIITPNIPEAEVLSGLKIKSENDMIKAARKIISETGAKVILIKGGHLDSESITDIMATSESIKKWQNKRIKTQNTHGTGCTLASAIATGLAQNMKMDEAIDRARKYVLKAIKTAPGYGKGHGPLNHVQNS